MTWIILILIAVAIGALLFYKVPAVNKFFKDSETVALQAVKAVLGLVGTIIALADPGQLQNATEAVFSNFNAARWWPLGLLIFGLVMLAVNRFRQKA